MYCVGFVRGNPNCRDFESLVLIRITQPLATTVLKIGGATLFAPRGMTASIELLRNRFRNDRVFFLFGGGDTVESMRTLHAIYPQLDAEKLHWRCIDLLDATWSVACELMPDCIPVSDASSLAHAMNSAQSGGYLVRTRAFYSPDSSRSIPAEWRPAVGWDTTSDALAWLLAKLVRADRLVLAKQVEWNNPRGLVEAARCGMIDSEIVRLVESDPDRCQLEIEFANLS
jgi:hypothetical protein